MLDTLKWLNIEQRLEMNASICLHKIKHAYIS